MAVAIDRWSLRAAVTWRRPEWWSLALGAVAWAILVAQAATGESGIGWSPHDHAPSAPLAHDRVAATWLAGAASWSLMVIAMMLPLVVDPIRVTASRSLWRRRDRAIAGFLVGYVGRWLAAGLAISLVVAFLRPDDWLPRPATTAIGFAIAASWQLAPMKWRALRSCHRTVPLAPTGWRADRDCVLYGWTIGGGCFVSCWALMLASALAGHSLIAMACVSAFTLHERYLARPNRQTSCHLLAWIALVYAALAGS